MPNSSLDGTPIKDADFDDQMVVERLVKEDGRSLIFYSFKSKNKQSANEAGQLPPRKPGET